jgi:hypothetical protein
MTLAPVEAARNSRSAVGPKFWRMDLQTRTKPLSSINFFFSMKQGHLFYDVVRKRPSAALPSSLVTAAYFYVRLIPRDFGSLASGHFPSASSASQNPVF